MLAILIMLPITLVSGLMPGGGLPIMIILLGFAPYLDPWISVTVAVFAMAGNDITEPMPSILMGIPGHRSAQATILDGYPMSKKGLAGIALGASYTCTLFGGLFGAAVLLISLPIAREFMQIFGSPEFFLLALLGIVSVAVVSAGAFVKGMLAAALGLAIAMIGFSKLTGDIRATFGISYLWDGFNLGPIVVGLFAIPEIVDLVVHNTTIARERVESMVEDAKRDVYKGMREAFNHKMLLFKSSLIGVIFGIMPGVGASAAHWISYAHARETEPGARETFGTGDIRGVIASDTPNNSSGGGDLIPTLLFGIPGSGGMTILLAILILSGIQPGPAMLTTHLPLTISLVFTLVLACTIVVPIVLYCAPLIVRTASVPPNILAPVVIAFVTLSAYMGDYSIFDLVVVIAFSVLGMFMKRYGWPRPPILISTVLAAILERYLWISMSTFGWEMLIRPQFIAIFLIMVGIIWLSLRVQIQAKRMMVKANREAAAHFTQTTGEPAPQTIGLKQRRRMKLTLESCGELILLLLVGAFFIYLVRESLHWKLGAQIIPWVAVAVGSPFLILRFLAVLWPAESEPVGTTQQIMDIGFGTSDDGLAGQRFLRICAYVIGLYLAIWLLGFHIALPLGTFLYLYIYGKAGLRWSAAIALMFLGLILGIYGELLHAAWHEPGLATLFPNLFGWL